MISTDSFQSADLAQALQGKGYPYTQISVDRVTNRVCEPYQYMRSTIYEERVELPQNTLMQEEFIALEKDGNGKIDHPSGFSKDCADAITGAIWSASLHAEQFEFDYGESLDAMIKISSEATSADEQRKQIQIAFEEEMQRLLKPINGPKREQQLQSEQPPATNKESIIKPLKDFGMGPSETYKPSSLDDGIIF